MNQLIYFWICTTIYALILVLISFKLSKYGSDNYGYNFYIQAIRYNNHRFIKSFDKFLNYSEPTDPQFFFWLLSYFSEKTIKIITVILNSLLFIAMGLVFYFFVKQTRLSGYVYLIYPAFLFTPIYFFGSNSRLYGLSARGIGLLLFFLLTLSVYFLESNFSYTWLLAGIFCGFLIWGSNLFAQQAFIGFSFFLLLQGYYWMAILLFLSVIVFIILCRGYAFRFFKNRANYFIIYKNILATKFILYYRKSIWLDFVSEFWNFKKKSFFSHLFYVYSNPVIQMIVFVPLVIIICAGLLTDHLDLDTVFMFMHVNYRFQFSILVAGISCFVFTSFRPTRFLGEPERYIEIANPFITILGCFFILEYFGKTFLIIYSIFATCFSLFLILIYILGLNSKKDTLKSDTNIVAKHIKEHAGNREVRFFSNNQEWMKFYLPEPFKMVYYYPTVDKLANIPLNLIMIKFPFVEESYIMQVLRYYKINYFLIDKNNCSLREFANMEELYEDEVSKLVFVRNEEDQLIDAI